MYFTVVLVIKLFEVFLGFVSMGEHMKCDHSTESYYQLVLSFGLCIKCGAVFAFSIHKSQDLIINSPCKLLSNPCTLDKRIWVYIEVIPSA